MFLIYLTSHGHLRLGKVVEFHFCCLLLKNGGREHIFSAAFMIRPVAANIWYIKAACERSLKFCL